MRKPKEIAQSSDIAFLLIIFFLLLSGLETSKALSLSSSVETIGQEVSVSLILKDDGTILRNGQILTPEACAHLFSQTKSADISIEDATSWQEVVDLLSLANRYGTEVSIHET